MNNQLILCVCGDNDMEHVDGTEQCLIVDCGCKEFELADHDCNTPQGQACQVCAQYPEDVAEIRRIKALEAQGEDAAVEAAMNAYRSK